MSMVNRHNLPTLPKMMDALNAERDALRDRWNEVFARSEALNRQAIAFRERSRLLDAALTIVEKEMPPADAEKFRAIVEASDAQMAATRERDLAAFEELSRAVTKQWSVYREREEAVCDARRQEEDLL